MDVFEKWKMYSLFAVLMLLLYSDKCESSVESGTQCVWLSDMDSSCEMCNLLNVKTLDCFNKSLETVTVNGSHEITGLNVSNNHLSTTPLIVDCPNVEWIDMSRNTELRVMNEAAFRNIKSNRLRILDLSNCGLIKIMPVPIKEFLPCLEILLMVDNFLSSLNMAMFKNMEAFCLLDVRNNGIKAVMSARVIEEQCVTVLVNPSDCNSPCAQKFDRLLSICQSDRQLPPRVLLSHQGSTLINATYDKEGTNQTYEGKTTYVEEGTQVNVTCLAEGAKPEAILTWTKNEDPIDSTVNTKIRNEKENRTFDTTSSLQFMANEENITISCNSSLHGTDIETLVSATFLTYVKPTVFFLLNGTKVEDSFYVPGKEYINIACYAEGARPAANLTLDGNNLRMKSFTTQTSDVDGGKFDSNLTFTVQSNFEKRTFLCTSTILEIDHTENISLELKTFVLPKPVITVNGNQSDDFIFYPSDKVTILCNASTARPTPRLTLTRNGEPFHDTYSDISGSPGVIVFFNFLPKHGDVVMCLSSLDKVNISKMANVTFYEYGIEGIGPFGGKFFSAVVIGITTLVFILLLVFIVYIAARKCKGSQYTDLTVNQGICMEDTSNALVRAQPVKPQKEYLTDTNIAYPKPPDIDLPKVPSDPDVHQYCDLPEENAYEVNFHKEYYSEMGSIDANRKMFSGKDVCFILNMKTGHIYNRWMGSIAVSKEEKKCVILSTVTDAVFRRNDIQWDKFVKQMLEVPEKRNLSKVEGIGISKGKLYIIHEHITCETLDVRVSAPFSRTEVMGHVLGIIEGLEIIQSASLVHPGLSTKKILFSEQGVCKLYDFCLSDDATNIVRIKKSRMIYTLNQFAPEALLRDEYDKTSDIWSVAVVIWEILSCGSCPFPNEEQQPDSQHVKLKLPETWPQKYNLLRNKLLYECWNIDVSLRPTIQQLKSSFVQSFESLDTYGSCDVHVEETPSSYVHMKEITKTEDES